MTQVTARLIPVSVPRKPAGVVLVLHGGAARAGRLMVSPTQLSVLRMIPIARHIARAGRRRLAVFRLLNSWRGWDTRHTPEQDARWALRQISAGLSQDLPACLVGHSLGGRAALLAGDEPGVVSAVALAPWVHRTDDADLTGKRILIVHGRDDRMARPADSAAVAATLGARADRAGYVLVDGGTHAMLRRHRQFTGLATGFALATLLGRQARGPVAEVLAGRAWLEI